MSTNEPSSHAGAWLVALSDLPKMGPARLRALLERWSPEQAWQAVTAGGTSVRDVIAATSTRRPDEVASQWKAAARSTDPRARWTEHQNAGVGVLGGPGRPLPEIFDPDPEPPAILFSRGDPDCVTGPRVAIVGTRKSTRYGMGVAWELGRDLAGAGVVVVSGLALGIDAAAHRGALAAESAPVVGVVATGLDVPYPMRNAALWDAVAQRGCLLSEAPLGTRPERWRFPARNRLLAALADVVVIVESPTHGGSMHTVAEAARRDRPVMAVPGPVGIPTSAGTNRLIAEGCAPVLDTQDVMVALGLGGGSRRGHTETRDRPSGPARRVLDALGWQPATLEQVAVRTGLGLGELPALLDELLDGRWIAGDGGWYERLARPAALRSEPTATWSGDTSTRGGGSVG